MLRFVDTQKELSYINKEGIPEMLAGLQLAPNDKPLDFQYESSEAVSSFVLRKIDSRGRTISETSLSTSLVTLSSNRHICTGQDSIGANLDECIYVFVVNGHYESEPFLVTYDLQPNYLELEDGTYLELEDGTYLELES